ncbi:putative protoporphyrinogen oxidase [Polaribacter irgensii 23-P]|uniref:Release factor glutamine methyltransferase n=2 Tax=Polaribacter TaxID=52959 RepID=A4C2P4_9FLAO|nr:putative protoporphyrinogen oxidase [Polaribacter irgensii 23-P]
MDAKKNMKLKEFKFLFFEALSDNYPSTEIESFFFILMEEKLQLKRIDTVLNPDLIIGDVLVTSLKKIIDRLQKEEPIQYILGNTEFYGLPFLVNKNTLIPRPETEELVSWVLHEIKEIHGEHKNKATNAIETPLTILDIGTGTGCISVSLAKNSPQSEITAIDNSATALHIAKKNALLNNVAVNFIQLDILKTTELPQKFDIIISNPPYVRELEKVEINKNVLANEPHLALFVSDENPLLFYDKIADLAIQGLTKNGLLFFEINQYLAKETIKMLTKKGFHSIQLKKDLFGNDRMLLCRIS